MLGLLKFSSTMFNWTRTMHSIKQHGTYWIPPIKYIALANYDGSNSSCLFSFYGQISLKKNEEKRLNSPCNRLDEEQLVVVSIFKCWSKNVYDDDDHHHQEVRSMSDSSSLVSLLTITFIHLASYWKRKKKKRDLSTIITRDPFPVHHHVIFVHIFFSLVLITRLQTDTHKDLKADTLCDLHLFIYYITNHFQA